MLHAGDINLAEMKLNKYTLKMRHQRLEMQYRLSNLDISIKHFKLILILALVLFIFW